MATNQSRTRLKVCCISSVDEALLAIRYGADALGLVGQMPSGPGVIADEQIARIAAATPPPIATFLLTMETDPDAVVDHARRCGTTTVQLVDDGVEPEVYHALRNHLPAVKIVQVLHVQSTESIAKAQAVSLYVDALLLDSGAPKASVRELGGTGRIHDWQISRQIVHNSPVPVFLAGGIHAQNVGDAIKSTGPFGIDLCSGVRTDGNLDEAKLRALTETIAKTDRI